MSTGIDKTQAPTEAQIEQLRALGLQVPRTCTVARNMINFFERARLGVTDPKKSDSYFQERVARIKGEQDKWLGKRVRMASGDTKRQNGRCIDISVTQDGNLQYVVDWGTIIMAVWGKSGIVLKPD